MSESDEFFHEIVEDGAPLQIQLPEYDQYSLSFVGRPDYETVTLYLFDMAENKPVAPIFECDKEHFELLLEQASGALMNAEGDFPQTGLTEEQFAGENND